MRPWVETVHRRTHASRTNQMEPGCPKSAATFLVLFLFGPNRAYTGILIQV